MHHRVTIDEQHEKLVTLSASMRLFIAGVLRLLQKIEINLRVRADVSGTPAHYLKSSSRSHAVKTFPPSIL